MPIEKIEDFEAWEVDECNDPDHLMPGMISLPPGKHVHTCPKCKRTTTIIIAKPRF